MQKIYRLRLSRPFDIFKYSKNDGKGNLTKIVFAYDFDTNDCLTGQLGNFFATKRLFDALESANYSGYKLVPVITRYSDIYAGEEKMEPVMRLEVTGVPGKDDFSLQNPETLIVSERVLGLLKRHGNQNMEVHDYDPNYIIPSLEALLGDSTDDE